MSTSINLDPLLVEIASQVSSSAKKTFVIMTPNEAEAQQFAKGLRTLVSSDLADNGILYMPGFVQAGQFRYESAKIVLATRLAALQRFSQHNPRVIIASISGLARTIPSPIWLQNNSMLLKVGENSDIDPLLVELQLRSYEQVERVDGVGQFSVRGGIVDLWSPGLHSPARIEFFGDSIERIRLFRTGDQRSYAQLDSIHILPTREFVWSQPDESQPAIDAANAYLLNQGITGSNRIEILEAIRNAIPFPGIDDFASVFANTSAHSFFHFINRNCDARQSELLLISAGSTECIAREQEDIKRLYVNSWNSQHEKRMAAVSLNTVFPDLELATKAVENRPKLTQHFAPPESLEVSLRQLEKRRIAERTLNLIQLRDTGNFTNLLLLCRSTDTFLETISIVARYVQVEKETLSKFELHPFNLSSPLNQSTHLSHGLSAAQADLEGFFFIPATQTLVISEAWFNGTKHDHSIAVFTEDESRDASRAASVTLMAAQFGDFIEGDLVVHVQHGIGRFLGLSTVTMADFSADFLIIEYAGNDRIYVPVNKMNLIQRYVGSSKGDSSVIDSLKGGSWEKRKAKAKADAEKLAKELMEHQAKRATTPGHIFSPIGADYIDFEAAFPYDETEDQLKAIREIMSDMSKPKAMDRLLVGDVGFGKTEVAMRAAHRANLDGKQVAWLVPTTVLAHQHTRSIKERCANFGTNICLLDRSLSGKNSANLLQSIKEGKQDIVIGTHRLLSKDLEFQNLGLLIVDEEHRFGVIQKERIKQMSYGIDVLTMTATPIPRTLQMAMIGLRDLSLLTTPPKARLAVKTFVCPYDEDIIKTAIDDELNRGGQVFFVHNRVQELDGMKEYLQKIVPSAKICIGHGQMGQKELDDTIIDFLDQKYNVLLCTTIIETGLDMPNVNTIFVQNANEFGLAQLYQLRGRVGRRASRGYAYFLMSPNINEDSEGMQRLNILREHQELGSGFVIASHDLEMRGAGNILGDEQSGKVSEVGLETYTQLLDNAIRSMGGIKVKATTEAEINIPVLHQIPADYIQNSKERLRTYRRFFAASTEDQLRNLVAECEDRFGPLPESVKSLSELSRIRRWLISMNAISLTVTDSSSEIRMSPDIFQASEDGSNEQIVKRILEVTNVAANRIRLTPDGRMLLPISKKNFSGSSPTGFSEIKRFLSQLNGEVLTAVTIPSTAGEQTRK